jgi:phage shock protein PspC (stress-responsive transcriptional regulator)
MSLASLSELGVIIFGSVRFLSKKVTKPKFFFKKIETRSNRPVSVRFGFLGKKPVQTGLARFFSVFPVLARFFRFGSVFFGFGSVFLVFYL